MEELITERLTLRQFLLMEAPGESGIGAGGTF